MVGVSHRHDVQNMLCSNVLQHPAPKGDRGLDTPSGTKLAAKKQALSMPLKRWSDAVLFRSVPTSAKLKHDHTVLSGILRFIKV